MSAPFSPEELRRLQAEWDAEAEALGTAMPQRTAPTLIEAWAELWQAAPLAEKAHILRLILLTPYMAAAFVLIWGMLP